jgi:hypothetical protein
VLNVAKEQRDLPVELLLKLPLEIRRVKEAVPTGFIQAKVQMLASSAKSVAAEIELDQVLCGC